jgi:Domain of unknown function (DUF4430)
VTRRLAALLAVLLVAACSGGVGGDDGTATLWVTRDRGAEVLHEAEVPAGVSVLQALDSEADVDTRFGGRFVQAIDGVEGSLAAGRDWFYFVNGYEADRGAAEYRLRAGDVAWWDFRSWSGGRERQPVVVGAFPEPFVHGYDGRTRPSAVRYADESLAGAARRLGELVGADSVASASVAAPDGANVLRLERGRSRFVARLRNGGSAGAPVEFVLSGDVTRLADDPEAARFRYEGLAP